MGLKTPVDHSQGIGPDNFMANPDTTGAQDTFVVIKFNIWMTEINLVLLKLTGVLLLFCFIFCGISFQVAGKHG